MTVSKSKEQNPLYNCQEVEINQFPEKDDKAWRGLPVMELLEDGGGSRPNLKTSVQSFWSSTRKAIYFRFICEDNNIVATHSSHDDPLYDEDVVEVFLSETGSLRDYKEFEVSPKNVKFDALIHNDPEKPLHVMTEWDAKNWRTESFIEKDQSQYISIWELPFDNFDTGVPSKGDTWRMNCYRIDRESAETGQDEYTAWSPTGRRNYHTPEKFGYLRFK